MPGQLFLHSKYDRKAAPYEISKTRLPKHDLHKGNTSGYDNMSQRKFHKVPLLDKGYRQSVTDEKESVSLGTSSLVGKDKHIHIQAILNRLK